jgi:hypothetical protein
MEYMPVYLKRQLQQKAREWVPDLEGWIPQYVETYGDLCCVTLVDDDRHFFAAMNTPQMFRLVCNHYKIDPKEVRKRYIQYTQMSQSIPIPILSRRLAFMAVKVRQPKCKNDSAFGYVASSLIEDVVSHGSRNCEVKMKSGAIYTLLMSKHHLIDQRIRAENLLFQFLQDERIL